jgi:cobalt transporter subunit CbtB
MTTNVWRKAATLTLSPIAQALLFLSLSSTVIWTVYFSTYPPVHNAVHSLRHHTLMISCH